MAHPYSTYPDICKEDTGNFDTPTTSIQEDGWPDSSVPAAKHFNWFAHWTSKWVNYLAGLVPDTLATSLAQILTNVADIATNAANIATNTADIASIDARVTVNEGDITTNTSNISSNSGDISLLQTDVAGNTTDIASNTSDISAMHNAGVQPVFYTPTDVYLDSDDPAVSADLIDIRFTVFNGLVNVSWDDARVIMNAANSTYLLYLIKTTSNWESFILSPFAYTTRFPIVVWCDSQYCAGMMSIPSNVDYTNANSRFYIYIGRPVTLSSEDYTQYFTNYFRGTSGITPGGFTYKTSIVTP